MPFSRDLPNPWIKPASLVFPALAGGLFTIGATWETPVTVLFSNDSAFILF